MKHQIKWKFDEALTHKTQTFWTYVGSPSPSFWMSKLFFSSTQNEAFYLFTNANYSTLHFYLGASDKLQGNRHEMKKSSCETRVWNRRDILLIPKVVQSLSPPTQNAWVSWVMIQEKINETRRRKLFHRQLAARLCWASWWSFCARDEWALAKAKRIKFIRRPLREKKIQRTFNLHFLNLIIQLLDEL